MLEITINIFAVIGLICIILIVSLSVWVFAWPTTNDRLEDFSGLSTDEEAEYLKCEARMTELYDKGMRHIASYRH